MAALSSTISSLSSISEDSTYGVEGEDLPPSVPRRRRSFGSRSTSATAGDVVSCNDETLESIHEEKTEGDVARPRRKSHSSGAIGNHNIIVGAEDEKKRVEERRSTPRRGSRRRSSTGSSNSSRSKHSSRESPRSNYRRNSLKSPRSRRRRSRSTSDLQKDHQAANRTETHFRSNSLRTLSSHHGHIDTSDRSQQEEKSKDIAGSKNSWSQRSLKDIIPANERESRDRNENFRRSGSRRRSSSSHRRSSSSTSESKQDLGNTSDRSQQEEKLKQMTRRKNSRSSRRSSSSSSERDTTNDGDESSKQAMVEDGRRRHRRSLSSSSGRRRRHSQLSLSNHSADSSTHFSRNLERRGAQHEFRRSTSSDGVDTESEVSDEESRPGAYRVSSYSTNRVTFIGSVPSSSGHTLVEENAMDDSDSSFSESESTMFSSSYATPASTGSTMVTAEVARDIADEIEAAREQGRAEGLVHVSNRNSSVVVAVPHPPRRPKVEKVSWMRGRKKWLILFGLCFFFILISGIVGYFVLIREDENEQHVPEEGAEKNGGGTVPEDSSGLEAMISFDPPTAEDCASIANGTDVAGQADMFTQYVDMRVELTTESEADASFLVELLQQQIQLNLMPLLVGCDDLEGNVMGNGVVQPASNETSTCLFQNNPLCLEVVLTVKIYLRRKEDGSTVVEVINNLLLVEDLNEVLGLPPTVQTVGVALIVPSDFSTDVPTETPSWSPSEMHTHSTVAPPSAMPNTSRPSATLDTAAPTIEPTQQPAPKPTPESSPLPTSSPANLDNETVLPAPSVVPSLLPTKTPSATPTVSPSASPSALPSASPSESPSALPSASPSAQPSSVPSSSPSESPSMKPTRSPSTRPSSSPTVSPAPSRSNTPSGSPTITPQPTVTRFFWVACGKVGSCHGSPASVQNANYATVGDIPSTLNKDMLAVRCCSDTHIERFSGPRGESCPFAESEIGGTCYNTATYYEAEDLCNSVGARLCTLEEIENDCTKASGCQHDYKMVWTSTQWSP